MVPLIFSKVLRRELANGQTLEQALVTLRAAGASILECIITVRSVRQYSLEEAKQRVQDSPAWADVRPALEELQEELAAELEKEPQADVAADESAPV